MEYELKHYYRVKYALVCARQSFLKNPPKDDYEEYVRKVIGRAYFIILKKIDELDGTNERLLKYYKENIENCDIIILLHKIYLTSLCAKTLYFYIGFYSLPKQTSIMNLAKMQIST